MYIEILAIGEEILQGNVVNTNASYLSKELSQGGYNVVRHRVIPDKQQEILEALRQIDKKIGCTIVTGGLGATLDDVTKKSLCKYFKTKQVFVPSLHKRLCKKFGDHSFLEEQAKVPEKATILENKQGCAPGFFFEQRKRFFFFLPGVPYEMKEMFLSQVLPFLKKKRPISEKKRLFSYHFCLLKEQDMDPFLRKMKEKEPELEIGIYPDLKKAHVTVKGPDKKEVKSLLKTFEKQFTENLFSKKTPFLEEAIQELFLEKKKRLALAESCTGGYIASCLTRFSGSSKYFVGSFVTYSNFLKQKVLGVKKQTLKQEGAVSKKTVEEMLQGVFALSEAEYGIAVSGVAGPSGGSREKPMGTVYVALGKKEEVFSEKIFIPKGRQEIIHATKNWVLSFLWQYVKYGKIPQFI